MATPPTPPSVADPVVSVVVVAWRSAPHLRTCLSSIAERESDVPYELVVVLNEPDEDLARFAATELTGAIVVRTRVNVGYGGAVNLGVRRARGEFVALLNDDAVIEEGWLAPLVETMRRRPAAGAVGSTTLFPDGSIQEAGSVIWSDGTTVKVGRGHPFGSRKYDYERRADFCSGTSLLLRRSSFEEAGGLDFVHYFPAYYEDTDLCLRLAERGEEIWYQPRSYVRHLESASTNFFYRDFLMARNRKVFEARWSALVSERVSPGARSEREVDLGLHRAMGSPVKVLVLSELASATLAERFLTTDRCHLTLSSPKVSSEDEELARAGVRVELGTNGPIELVRSECPEFSLLLDLREVPSEDASRLSATLGLPVARPLPSSEVLFSVEGLDTPPHPVSFAELIALLDNGAMGVRR